MPNRIFAIYDRCKDHGVVTIPFGKSLQWLDRISPRRFPEQTGLSRRRKHVNMDSFRESKVVIYDFNVLAFMILRMWNINISNNDH